MGYKDKAIFDMACKDKVMFALPTTAGKEQRLWLQGQKDVCSYDRRKGKMGCDNKDRYLLY